MWSLKMATYLTQMKPTEYAYIFEDLKNLYIPEKHSLTIAIAYICILYVNRLSCDKKKFEAKKNFTARRTTLVVRICWLKAIPSL